MYCDNCINFICDGKRELQNINRCCRGQICKICMNILDLYYMNHGHYMCFYCKAHSSRYKYNDGLKFDKAYKYKIYKHILYSFTRCIWYIDFDICREGDRYSYITIYKNGSIEFICFQLNNKYIYRIGNRPSIIAIDNKTFCIQCLRWFINDQFISENNKKRYIFMYNNGNLHSLILYIKQDLYIIQFDDRTDKQFCLKL